MKEIKSGDDSPSGLVDAHTSMVSRADAHTHTSGINHLTASTSSSYNTYKKDILEKVRKEQEIRSSIFSPGRKTTVTQEVKKRKEEIENEDLEQNIRLKKHTLYALFGFLAGETILIFFFSWFQATGWWSFHLEEWSFKLLVAATISQITFMIQVAVKHLFPTKRS